MRDAEEMRGLIDKVNLINSNSVKDSSMDFRFNHVTASFANPVSLYFAKYGFGEGPLCEGLIRTYPIDTAIRYVRDYFNLGDDIKKVRLKNGKEHIIVKVPDIGENIDVIEKALDVCGYYMSLVVSSDIVDDVKWVTLQFEAKFQEDESETIRNKETHLYHLTPKYNEEKILKDGFSPRCKNEIFYYPGRIYFLNGSVSEKEIVELCIQLGFFNKSKGNNFKYTIFDIDLSKIPENIPLYTDPNYPHGVFVNENLRPDCIIRVGDIDFPLNGGKIDWR